MMTARELAFDVLSRAATSSLYVSRLLDERLSQVEISLPDRRLATELVHGVVRRRATLDALLRPLVQRRPEDVEPGLRILLHLGAYQLVLLSGVPPHAAVNETAELAKQIGKPRWTGFINGVLRSLSRAVTDEMAEVASAACVPLTGGRYRRMRAGVFPDPATTPVGYFAAAFSFPQWLAERWSLRFDGLELQRLGFWFNSPLPLCLRVNALQTTRDDFLSALQAAGIGARPGCFPQSVWLEQAASVVELPGFQEGWFVVQDESAMSACALLAPRAGERVLDLCAAPGGKTTHLAELMQNEGTVVATDVDAERLAMVGETSQRLKLEIVETQLIARDATDLPAGPFDAVLLDAPCSNTGVLGKRTEARWRLRPQDIPELAELQVRLLEAAVSRLSAGGRVVYSTCSIEPDENRAVVDAVLQRIPGLRLVNEVVHQPGHPADGGYQALLKR